MSGRNVRKVAGILCSNIAIKGRNNVVVVHKQETSQENNSNSSKLFCIVKIHVKSYFTPISPFIVRNRMHAVARESVTGELRLVIGLPSEFSFTLSVSDMMYTCNVVIHVP